MSDKMRIFEEFSLKVHDLHSTLRHDLLKGLNDKKHDKVVEIMNLSKEGLSNYTSQLYAHLNDVLGNPKTLDH